MASRGKNIAVNVLHRNQALTQNIIVNTSEYTKLICYYVMRWKYGYGKKRYEKFQCTVQNHIDYAVVNRLDMADYQRVVNEKCGIDIKEIVGSLSFRELLAVGQMTYPKKLELALAYKSCISESIEMYFDYIASSLKVLGWSNPEISRYFGYVIELMQDLEKEYFQTDGIEETIFDETGYNISRLVEVSENG